MQGYGRWVERICKTFKKKTKLSANISNMSESVLSDIETLIDRLSLEDEWECFV